MKLASIWTAWLYFLDWIFGLGPPAPTLAAPAIPRFTVIRKDRNMTLNFAALAVLPDPSYVYVLTVTPNGGTAISQTHKGGDLASFSGVPAGAGVVSEVVQDKDGDTISGVSTRPYVVLAAPVIPAFSVADDAVMPTPTPVPAPVG